MNKNDLSHAIRGKAADTEDRDAAELMRVLARLIEGTSIQKAFGAPGDWGYNTAIGAALAASEKGTP